MTDHPYDDVIAAAREELEEDKLSDREGGLKLLLALRNYREHALLSDLAERYLLDWPGDPAFTEYYAQATIELGKPHVASGFLKAAIAALPPENTEAHRLLALVGRSEKDLFQKALGREKPEAAKAHAQASYDAYRQAMEADPRGAYYPAINAAAVAYLARDESISMADGADPLEIAKDVKEMLKDADPLDAWAHATRAEACIPLGDWDGVEEHLGKYLSLAPTPFQINGTHRQFRDVWRLDERGRRGQRILTMLDAGGKGALKDSPDQNLDLTPAPQSFEDEIPQDCLEKVLGSGGLQSYRWLMDGLARARSVASVVTQAGKRIGTSFVIDPEQFGLTDATAGKVCMMTNYHVMNRNGDHGGLKEKSGAKVRFEAREPAEPPIRVREILFESPLKKGLDCTIFTIDADAGKFDTVPLEPQVAPDLHQEDTPRVYIIGYPLGGEMQFSLQDNRLLDHECPPNGQPPTVWRCRLHYFAPTEPGNSGSPVFNEGWDCVALHHAGRKLDPARPTSGMPRLNGQDGRHSANQGIWIGSIIEAVRGAQDGHPPG